MKKLILGLVFVLALSACSVEFSIGGKNPGAAAADLIEGEIAQQVGWTLDADCPELESPEAGDAFECTATNEFGDLVRFRVDVGEDEVDVNSTNVLRADVLTRTEADIAAALAQQTGLPLPAEYFDCGSGAIAVPDDGHVLCSLTDPVNGDVYDADVTLYLGDPIRFDVSVAPTPRG